MAAIQGGLMQNRRDAEAGFLHRLSDPDYRLHGENPASASLEDARHWTATYDRLISFKHELLDLCQRYAEKSGPEVALAIQETDMILLEVQLSRFQQRRDFWKLRATELAGDGRRRAAS